MKSEVLAKTNNHDIHNLIISRIRDLILHKNLEPGDKLPSERVLSEKFGVSRRNLKEAISILSSYELVKSIPQSGTVLANIGQIALVGIIDNILALGEDDFKSLVETRILLELKTTELAAKKRTKKALKEIEKNLNKFKKKTLKGEDALQEDLLFHLAIAKACDNTSIYALMLQITPKLISVFEYNRIINEGKSPLELKKNKISENQELYEMEVARHVAIFEAIRDQDPQLAVKCMEKHFEEVRKRIN